METPQQGGVLASTVALLIGTIVVIQLWILSASIEAWHAGQTRLLIPAAVVSLVLFLANLGLLWYVADFDERLRRFRGEDWHG